MKASIINKQQDEHYALLTLQLDDFSAPKPGQYSLLDNAPAYFLHANTYQKQLQLLCAPCDNKERDNVDISWHGDALPAFTNDEPILLLGSGLGIAPIIALACQYKSAHSLSLLALAPSTVFRLEPDHSVIPNLPAEATATLPLFKAKKLACRIANPLFTPGCFEGSLASLANNYLSKTSTTPIIYAVGDEDFLDECQQLDIIPTYSSLIG